MKKYAVIASLALLYVTGFGFGKARYAHVHRDEVRKLTRTVCQGAGDVLAISSSTDLPSLGLWFLYLPLQGGIILEEQAR